LDFFNKAIAALYKPGIAPSTVNKLLNAERILGGDAAQCEKKPRLKMFPSPERR